MAARNGRGFGRRIVVAAVLLVAIYFGYHHFFGKGDTAGGKPSMPPAEVSAVTVNPADTALIYEYAGRVAGSREAEIRARVSGILLQRTYTEGTAVKRGDILFRIDPAPFNAALADAQAKFTQAQREWQRSQKLYKVKALSAREYDQTQSAYQQAKAVADTARINLGYTTVRAPISGITSHESVTEGTLVAADTTLLTRVSQLDPIYIYFGSPDEEMLNLRKRIASGTISMPASGKLRAEIHLADTSTYADLGTVDFTDSIIDPSTGTVSMRVTVPNRSNTLLPGQFVRVYLKGLVAKGAMTVPDQAIMQGPKGTFVYTIDNEHKAQVTAVELGRLNGDMRLIESGLKAGDQVITEGMIKVQPQSEVKISEPAPVADAPAATPAPDKKG